METINSEIVLKPDSLISDIQSQFNSLYPFLKIEFLKNNSPTSGKSLIVNTIYRLKDLSNFSTTQKINVDKTRTVAEIAADCINKIGLSVQVLRKSGNVWNLISLTDSWTLENQNDAGAFISSEMAGASGMSVKLLKD